jgi:SAM-dependent methyltransferase
MRPMPSSRIYDLLYRTGAARWRRGWEVGVGPELRRLVESGVAAPDRIGDRAVDLGCGVGTNVLYLAGNGFEATGVDFSAAAIEQARRAAAERGLRATFVVGDVTRPIPGLEPPFDLILLYNVVQDLDRDGRRRLADETARLAQPGTLALVWCWYAPRSALPLISYRGPSRVAPFVVEPGEERELFAHRFDVERIETDAGPLRAAFLLRAR